MTNDELYYDIAEKAGKDITSPVFVELQNVSNESKKILDLGCGDGTRLALLSTKAEKWGIDINRYAVDKGKKKYPQLNLAVENLEKLPFRDADFDLVYSTFVLEHLSNPEKVINEAVRVLAHDGILLLAAPNYGAPNRRSPCNFENKFIKILRGIPSDYSIFFRKSSYLNWKRVNPRTNEPYRIDFDTQVEPYLLTLESFLKSIGLLIVKRTSLWIIPEENKQTVFKIIRRLGQFHLFPFYYWGPQLLLIAKKT